MIPILSIVGKSHSGKTTLLEKLVRELTRRGYTIATVKHDIHSFNIDKEGKDSWRHKQAGATTTIISSPRQVAVMSDTTKDLRLSELRQRYLRHEDILLSEGYSRDCHPKIEVSKENDPQKLLSINDPTLIAVATPHSLNLPVPWFHRDDVIGIADFIEATFLSHTPRPPSTEASARKGVFSASPCIAGIILSGGKNTRMGKNKAFLQVRGKSIIDRTVELFHSLFNQVILVTNEPLEYAHLDAEIVRDFIPSRGSLVGLYTGLFHSRYYHSFVVACDMPFLNRTVIEYMIGTSSNYDVVIPHLDDGYHPLHALYSKRCMKWMEKLIQEGNFKIIDFFKKVKVKEIHRDEFLSLDLDLRSFVNINTPQDFEALQHLP